MKTCWLLSCEHGGNKIPAPYSSYFSEATEVLETHRGWDPGALALFTTLKPLADFAHSSTISRLLVELNRSLHHPNLFSAYTKSLSKADKNSIIENYYFPYRQLVQQTVDKCMQSGKVTYHLSIHSFTPVLNNEVRRADIGLLYDPGRVLEKNFCKLLKQCIKQQLPELTVRFNYPYLGTADGFTTHLRKQFPANYAGVEVELNQRWANTDPVYQGLFRAVEQAKALITLR